MEQDFSRRVAIVVCTDLPAWQVLNTVAHIAAYFGNRIGSQFGTGAAFVTRDGQAYPRNSQYPIIILSADRKQLAKLIPRMQAAPVEGMYFLREMIESTDDEEIALRVAKQASDALECLGIGLFGDHEQVKRLTKGCQLWRAAV